MLKMYRNATARQCKETNIQKVESSQRLTTLVISIPLIIRSDQMKTMLLIDCWIYENLFKYFLINDTMRTAIVRTEHTSLFYCG